MENARKHLIGNVRKFEKHPSLEEFTIREDGLGSGESKEAVLGTSRMATSVYILLSVSKTLTSVEAVVSNVRDSCP